MLNLIVWNSTENLYKIDLELNNPQRLKYHKTQPTNYIYIYIYEIKLERKLNGLPLSYNKFISTGSLSHQIALTKWKKGRQSLLI